MADPIPPPRAKTSWDLIKETYAEWSRDRASLLAAAFSYYAVFALTPLLLIAIAIAGLVFGERAARGEIQHRISDLVGAHAAGFIEQLLTNAGQRGTGIAATLISFALLLYTASNLFASLQESLNTIWNVTPRPDRSWVDIIRERAITFAMVVGIGILVLASIIASAAISAAAKIFGGMGPALAQVGLVALSIVLFSGVFALLLKYLPDVRVGWRDVFVGAIFAAVGMTLARWILGWYLSRPSTTSIYGAAGSLVLILLFIYYTAQILFFAAEFTQVWARRSGRPIEPAHNAICRDQHSHKKISITTSAKAKHEEPTLDVVERDDPHWRLTLAK